MLFFFHNNLKSQGHISAHIFLSHSWVYGLPGGWTGFRRWVRSGAAALAPMFSQLTIKLQETLAHDRMVPLQASAQNWQLSLPPISQHERHGHIQHQRVRGMRFACSSTLSARSCGRGRWGIGNKSHLPPSYCRLKAQAPLAESQSTQVPDVSGGVPKSS